ncbi:eukaryotic translation initiation factor 5B isoform X2 [Haemaphysalis longicornis]
MEGLSITDKAGAKKKADTMGDGPNEDVPTRKGKAKKGANRVEDSDDDEPAKPAKGAAGKKAKGKKGRGDDESDEDAEDAKPTTKKGKKGKRGDDSDEEEEVAKPAAKAKKGKKKGAEESDDEAEVVKPAAKGKKGRKKGGDESEEDEEPVKPAAKGKKGKKKGGDESDEEEEEAKPAKGKKGKKKGGDESDDEEEEAKPAKGKKGKKKGGDESDDEDEVKPAAKGKKGKKAVAEESDDEAEAKQPAKAKKGKKKGGDESDGEEEVEEKQLVSRRKQKKGKVMFDESGEEDDEMLAAPALAKNKKNKKQKDSDDEHVPAAPKKKMGGFALLDDGDDEDDDDGTKDVDSAKEDVEEPEKVVKEEKKEKKKKEKKKKKNQDDDELEKMLEELTLEIEGKKPPPTKESLAAAAAAAAPTAEEAEAKEAAVSKKKKKKDKKAAAQDEAPPEGAEEAKDKEETAAPAAAAAETKKAKKKKKDAAKKEAEAPAVPSKEATPAPAEGEEPAPAEGAEGAEEEGGEGKKKKKKKEEDDKKKLKKPGSKQIAAIQEHLRKIKEEEEKRKKEEEERIKAEEEAERLREEKLKQEQERKERKKQKEKERRERAKAEGRLLTKAQKTARARMEATLKALKEQGIEVPQIGEKKEKVARMDRRRNQRLNKKPNEEAGEAEKKAETIPQVQLEILGPDGTAPSEQNELQKEMSPTEVPEEEEDDVKDAWDATSSSEEEEEDEEEVSEAKMKADAKPETKTAAPKKPAPAKKAETAKKRQESSSSESEDEDSESDDSSEESSSDSEDDKSHSKEKVMARLQRQREEAEKKRSVDNLRSPVICVLGHVDTGKTKILDTIRHTHVQDSEAGGITQQIGATMVPLDAIKEQCKMAKEFANKPLKIPGLLIIDTPGHESFSNLRSRGSSLCDMAILVVDLMHGLEPQTIESLNMLRSRKTPFVVALNKVDRLYDWKGNRNKDITDVLKAQSRNTRLEFEERTREVVLQFAEQGLNAALFHENKDQRTFISLVPTSALSGDGMGNLISLIVDLTQNMMAKRIAFSEELQATVLEVKAIPGLGTTIDVILVNGTLREGDTMVLAGHEGPFTTPIRSLLMPQPMKELRVKNPYQEYKEVRGAQGVKIAAKDLDKAIAGLQVLVAHHPDEVEVLKEEVARALKEVMSGFRLSERGVYVQASTLGSLEALLEFLRVSKISYSGIRIGPVVKKDVMKASIMLEHDAQFAVILAFDVKIERDAQELADSLGVKIFQADIIYHLFDKFTAYREELRQKKREEFKSVAVFPCKLRILPQFVFNSRDPIVVGVSIEAGVVKEGTPLCVPSKEFLDIGIVTTIEVNHKQIESARKGQEVCIKIEPLGGEAPKMYGRHFDHTDFLVSKISRASIDACKEHFRDDLIKTDWQLMVELKKLFQIL